MDKIQKIYKNIDVIMEVIFGSKNDDDGMLYSEVYRCEIVEALNDISHFLERSLVMNYKLTTSDLSILLLSSISGIMTDDDLKQISMINLTLKLKKILN